MKPLIVLIGCLGAFVAAAQTPPQAPSAESILKRIDENQVSGSRITVYEMTIRGRRGSRTMKVVPSAALDSTVTVPPWAVTICCTM